MFFTPPFSEPFLSGTLSPLLLPCTPPPPPIRPAPSLLRRRAHTLLTDHRRHTWRQLASGLPAAARTPVINLLYLHAPKFFFSEGGADLIAMSTDFMRDTVLFRLGSALRSRYVHTYNESSETASGKSTQTGAVPVEVCEGEEGAGDALTHRHHFLMLLLISTLLATTDCASARAVTIKLLSAA